MKGDDMTVARLAALKVRLAAEVERLGKLAHEAAAGDVSPAAAARRLAGILAAVEEIAAPRKGGRR